MEIYIIDNMNFALGMHCYKCWKRIANLEQVNKLKRIKPTTTKPKKHMLGTKVKLYNLKAQERENEKEKKEARWRGSQYCVKKWGLGSFGGQIGEF